MNRSSMKNILVAIATSNRDGNLRISGVFDYLSTTPRAVWNPIIFNTHLDILSGRLPDMLDGAIVSCGEMGEGRLNEILSRCPTVVMSESVVQRAQKNRPVSSVLVDNLEIGRLAAQHFIRHGKYATYAFVHSYETCRWSQLREQGFCAELGKSGDCRIFRPTHRETEQTTDDWNGLPSWLKGLSRPVALFAANDATAAIVQCACREADLDVPEEIGILGCDNDPLFCERSAQGISSVEPPFRKAGFEAAHLLDRLITCGSRRTGRQTIVLCGARLVERGSTTYVSSGMALVNKAQSFIAEHACERIRATDVVRHTGVSRSLLEMRFRTLRQTSILQEILSVRFKRLEHLLKTTARPVQHLSAETGFHSYAQLMRLFKKRYGMTIGKWRRSQKASADDK